MLYSQCSLSPHVFVDHHSCQVGQCWFPEERCAGMQVLHPVQALWRAALQAGKKETPILLKRCMFYKWTWALHTLQSLSTVRRAVVPNGKYCYSLSMKKLWFLACSCFFCVWYFLSSHYWWLFHHYLYRSIMTLVSGTSCLSWERWATQSVRTQMTQRRRLSWECCLIWTSRNWWESSLLV